VDDYHGWSASPPEDKDGAVLPDLTGWRRAVTVAYVDSDDATSPATGDTGLKRVTVNVTDPRGKTAALAGLRSRYGIYDHAPPRDTTYVSWVGMELRIAADGGARIVSGACPLNRIPTQGP